MSLADAVRPGKLRFLTVIQEARGQRARPTMVVCCPGVPEALTVTVRSRFGPMCSACGAVIDSSPSHAIIDSRHASRRRAEPDRLATAMRPTS
jgi:hypothetical protein